MNCLLLIFSCCLICVDFFCYPFFFFVIPYFVFFVNFGRLSLPCHLLCCLLLFVYFIYLFFTFMDFLGGWGVVSLIALGTSSLRLIVFPLGGWLHRAPVSRTGIEG